MTKDVVFQMFHRVVMIAGLARPTGAALPSRRLFSLSAAAGSVKKLLCTIARSLRGAALAPALALSVFLLVLMLPGTARCGVLVSFDVADATSSSMPLAPNYVGGSNSVMSATDLYAVGLYPTWACCQNSLGELSFSGWGIGGSCCWDAGNPGDVGFNGSYLEFSVTATAAPVQLSELDFSWLSDGNSYLTITGPDEVSVYASFNNFATPGTLVGTQYVPNSFPWSGGVVNIADNMSAYIIDPGQTLSIRWVAWSDVGSWDSGAGPWNNNHNQDGQTNILLQGTGSAPEPASFALLLSGLAGILTLRKRKR